MPVPAASPWGVATSPPKPRGHDAYAGGRTDGDCSTALHKQVKEVDMRVMNLVCYLFTLAMIRMNILIY